MFMKYKNGQIIQGAAINPKMELTGAYTVEPGDTVIEFTTDGTIAVTFNDGSTAISDYPVKAGSRYAISDSVVTITPTVEYMVS